MASAYKGNKPYIFLSYAHKDKELADYVVDYLQKYNFNVWFDEGIHSGTQWKEVILEKIANPNCWMMVFLATQNSLASKECKKELYFAEVKEKKFINVVIGSPKFHDWFICDFTCYQFVDEAKFASRDEMMDKLVKELIHHQMNTDKPTDTPKETPKETPKAKAPWVCKNCGSNNSGDDDVCEVCGSSDRYVAPKETPAPSSTEGLEFTVTDGTATVTSYKGTDSKVIIPATIIRYGKTYKVTSIGVRAFEGCKTLTSITIPNSVTSIGYGAFLGCSSLISITIPDSVTAIGESAFEWCNNLTSITIPNSVTTIGFGAFAFCENLTIYCEAKSKPEGWSSLWNPRNHPVVWGPLEVNTTEGLKFTVTGGIATVTGYTGTDSKVIIPATITRDGKTYKVTAIGGWAFSHCENLTSITIPNSVISIGKSAFDCCKNLTSITIPNRVTSIGSFAFSWCTKLTSITIPNSVTSIGHYAFYKCKNLTIYCEAKSKPEGWDAKWKPRFRPVVWGHKIK